ncbi:MAG: TRAP transporter small permease subunit [Pseudomonadota bacterium]
MTAPIGATLLKLEVILSATLLVLMVGLIFLGGVARMMATPLNWTIDMATCFFAWGTFLAADVAWRRDGLMSVNLIPTQLSARAGKVLTLVNYILISGFLVYLVYAGTWLTWVSRSRSFQGIPEISFSFVTASLPVGAALLLMTTLVKTRRLLAPPKEDRAKRPVAPH